MDSSAPVPFEHIVFTDFDGGEGVLVDLNTKRYYQLNETAMLVWRGLERRRTVNEIIAEIVSLYDVTPEHAARSVERLLGSFRTHKLVRPA